MKFIIKIREMLKKNQKKNWMKVKLFGLFNHLLSNMFRQYDESYHQAF